MKLILPAFALLALPAAAQTTWYVDVNGTPPGLGTQSNPYTSIQFAHDQTTTQDWDTIRVRPGTYHENLVLTKRVTIASTQGPQLTILRPAVAGTIVRLLGPADENDALVLEGFTITGMFGSTLVNPVVSSWEGTLRRCLIVGNHGFTAVRTEYDTNLYSCVITDNGAGVECSTLNDVMWMYNTVLWGNAVDLLDNPQPSGEIASYNVGALIHYAFGVGNIVGDPLLWDVAHGDFRLKPGSPCIDAGDPALFDPDGSRLDVGVFPYEPLYAPLATYCTGKLNSDGCVPVIGASGQASATSASPFLVTGQLLLAGKTSLLLYGFFENSLPFQGATLCIGGSLHRAGLQISAGSGFCGGTTSFDFNPRIQSGVDPALVPGKLVFAQWYQRDPLDPAGFASGLTNGLRFGIVP